MIIPAMAHLANICFLMFVIVGLSAITVGIVALVVWMILEIRKERMKNGLERDDRIFERPER